MDAQWSDAGTKCQRNRDRLKHRMLYSDMVAFFPLFFSA